MEVKEFGVPDVVKSMSWCGENICIGIRREYMILNSTNGALSEVFPSGRIAPPLVVSLPSGELLLGKVLAFPVCPIWFVFWNKSAKNLEYIDIWLTLLNFKAVCTLIYSRRVPKSNTD